MTSSRRQFFTQFGRVLAQSVMPETSSEMAAEPSRAEPPRPWLRPPGALPEPEFLQKCTRCTDCLEACPYDSIRRLGPEFGEAAETPAVIPLETPCYLCKDMPCIKACEIGALLDIPRRQVEMGTAVIDLSACYLALGQPCDYCVERCPLKNEAIAFGAGGPPEIDESSCTGCGVCAYLCPADAISITPNIDRDRSSGSQSERSANAGDGSPIHKLA